MSDEAGTGELFEGHEAAARTTLGAPSRAGALEPELPVGEVVGGFGITGFLGSGGMGVVYRARQRTPDREVALKVIRAGVLSPPLLRRFEYEVEILGRLEHPGIARIFAAGTHVHDGGRQPYFAMELVTGDTLLDHCEHGGLSVRAKLELIARVCDAMEHAHQKGVIHRDLKPSNILVTESGQPKVLDFGVARATESDLQATVHTSTGQIVGTVPYMSPEQIAGDARALDVRSDVYALGVVLHEALSGRLPYDVDSLSIFDVARIIREHEPSRLGRSDPALRGDIETIALKALEKDPERRYASAAALAEDLRRVLHHQPILARPASTTYHLAKFARRNKLLVAAAGAAVLALLAGVVASTVFALNANTERKNTEQALAFQSQMLRGIVPHEMGLGVVEALRSDVRRQDRAAVAAFDEALAGINYADLARGVLDDNILSRAAETLDTDYADRPRLEASLRMSLGEVYAQIDMFEAAFAQFERAADLIDANGGTESAAFAQAANYAALVAFWDLKLTDARAMLDRVVAARGIELDVADPTTIETGILDVFMNMQNAPTRDQAAEYSERLERAYELTSTHEGLPVRVRAVAALELGRAYKGLGRFEESYPLMAKGLELADEAFGPTHVYPLLSRGDLVQSLLEQGRFLEARPHAERALDAQRRVLGNESRFTHVAMDNLARVHHSLGDTDLAESLYRESISTGERVYGLMDDGVLVSRTNLAKLLGDRGEYEQSRDLYLETLGRARRSLNFVCVGMSSQGLGRVRMHLGEYEESEADLQRSLQVLSTVGNIGEHSVNVSLQMLVDLYTRMGREADAAEYRARLPDGWDPPD
ncbi:MAG: serine/threonine-protein kinase [Planctomycetota bacterium]